MKDAGVDITNADLQALTWYREQQFFKKAGVLQKGSDNVDYLDELRMRFVGKEIRVRPRSTRCKNRRPILKNLWYNIPYAKTN